MLIKVKPTSPGRRQLVKVVTPGLHKGDPHWALLESEKKTAGRNTEGRITMRHKGGGHKQHYRKIDLSATRMASPRRSSASNTIRTEARISRCSCTRTASAATSSRRKA
jgi:ribosomal protein L2